MVGSDRPGFTVSLFYLSLTLLLVPIWAFPYFPSEDGPSHLFNANVFLSYSRVPAYRHAFILHVPSAGNLTGHALAMVMMRVGLAPEVCEKVLMSICIAGLAIAFHYAVRGVKSAPMAVIFLVLPFLYNWPQQMGFWSFSLGVPFVLLSVGLCFRHAGNWDLKSLAKLFLIALAAYACHPISWAVSALVTGAVILVWMLQVPSGRFDWRWLAVQALLPLAVFVPFLVPNLLFAQKNQLVKWETYTSFRERLWPVYTMSAVHLFKGDAWAAKVLFVFLVAATALSLMLQVRKRRLRLPDTLLFCTVLFVLLSMYCPGRIGEGTFIAVRFLLFACLFWVLWLAITVPSREFAKGLAVTAVAITTWQVAARLPSWRMFNRDLIQFVKVSSAIAPASNVCQFDFWRPTDIVFPMEHAVDLLLTKQVVDVRDYEAGRKAFWTEFRNGYFLDENYLAPTSFTDLEGAMTRFATRTGEKIDYIILTDLPAPPEQSIRKLLPSFWTEYRLIAVSSPASIAAVFKRKAVGL